jgi:hypothetical protein
MRRNRRSRRRRGLITPEWIMFVTILCIGTIAGLVVVRNAILSELKDISQAIEFFNMFGP